MLDLFPYSAMGTIIGLDLIRMKYSIGLEPKEILRPRPCTLIQFRLGQFLACSALWFISFPLI